MKMTEAEVLKKFPGLRDIKPSKHPSSPVRAQKKRELCDFAYENGLVMHPSGYEYYIEGYFMFGHCPCDVTRKKCPCDEAVEEVHQNGYCKCRLFWRSFKDFKEEMLKEA